MSLPEIKLTKEEMLEILKKIPTHTDKCYTAMVGGYLGSLGDNTDKTGSRQVWMCADDCPIKGKDF